MLIVFVGLALMAAKILFEFFTKKDCSAQQVPGP